MLLIPIVRQEGFTSPVAEVLSLGFFFNMSGKKTELMYVHLWVK